jgi:hypothetical protein
VAGDYVNLNDVGALARSGGGYDATAQDNTAESRAFSGRMDASRQGLRGSAGTTFTSIADLHSGNLVRLANQIAEQAVRAVRSEQTVDQSDHDANTQQASTMQTVEGLSISNGKPINAF